MLCLCNFLERNQSNHIPDGSVEQGGVPLCQVYHTQALTQLLDFLLLEIPFPVLAPAVTAAIQLFTAVTPTLLRLQHSTVVMLV